MDRCHRVVTINWNGREYIRDMVDSLLPQLEETSSTMLLFDNGSSDGSAELAEQEYGSTGLVDVEYHGRNIGFGPAANLILTETALPEVVLVNTDTVVLPGCLRKLLEVMEEHEEVSFAAPRLLWPDGSLQSSMRDFPFPMNLVKEHLPLLRRSSVLHSDHRKSGYADWIIGAMMVIRTGPFLEIGGFSPEFDFFYEEADLQYRLLQRGWRSWFEASAEVIHHEGGSCRQIYGDHVYLQHIPGKLTFLRRNGTVLDRLLFRLLMSALQLGRLLSGKLRRREDPRWTAEYSRKALKLLWKK